MESACCWLDQCSFQVGQVVEFEDVFALTARDRVSSQTGKLEKTQRTRLCSRQSLRELSVPGCRNSRRVEISLVCNKSNLHTEID